MHIQNFIRKNILELQPYSSARDEYKGKDAIFLDANENPFGELNRYPDPQQDELKTALSKLKNIPTNNIFIGNGSDEVIDIAYRIFCEPGVDKALTFTPTYGMYDVSAAINNIELIKIQLTTNFQIDFEAVHNIINDEKIKIIFICSPNNPTANNLENIERIVNQFKGIVFIDEAYIDFSEAESFINKISAYPNVIVSQTFSKAWGLAAARVGVAYSSTEIISWYNKVKPPYNISLLNQQAALQCLQNEELFLSNKNKILQQRAFLLQQFESISTIKKVYPSHSNFILIEVEDANETYNFLVSKKVITRNRNSVIQNCIRITIGTEEENQKLLTALKELNNL